MAEDCKVKQISKDGIKNCLCKSSGYAWNESSRLKSVSEQQRTYPSPNPTSTLSCYQLTVLGCCSHENTSPRPLHILTIEKRSPPKVAPLGCSLKLTSRCCTLRGSSSLALYTSSRRTLNHESSSNST